MEALVAGRFTYHRQRYNSLSRSLLAGDASFRRTSLSQNTSFTLLYFLLSQIPTLDDGDFTVEAFKSVYQADLANGLGNLAARLAKLCEQVVIDKSNVPRFPEEYKKDIEQYRLNNMLQIIRI